MTKCFLDQVLGDLWYLCKQWSKQIISIRTSTALCSLCISSHLVPHASSRYIFSPTQWTYYSVCKLTATICFSDEFLIAHLSHDSSSSISHCFCEAQIVNAWENSSCEHLYGWMHATAVPTPLGKHIFSSSQQKLFLSLYWKSLPTVIAACSHCLCDSSQPVSFSTDTFPVHHNLSLFCTLASVRVKCLDCLEPASGVLTPLKSCVWVCVHVHSVSSSFLSFFGLPSHVHTDSNTELKRENKSHIKYSWKTR